MSFSNQEAKIETLRLFSLNGGTHRLLPGWLACRREVSLGRSYLLALLKAPSMMTGCFGN